MLEFMNRPEFYQRDYFLASRIGDCEPNLLSFNYITPMAICVEAMVKSALIKFDNRITEDEAGNVSLYNLLFNPKVEEVRQYLPFRKWFKEQYDIDNDLLNEVKRLIKESNKYKHSLLIPDKRNKDKKKPYFLCFYSFTAKYFEHKTGEEAPPWDDAQYDDLMRPDDERSIDQANRLMKMR